VKNSNAEVLHNVTPTVNVTSSTPSVEQYTTGCTSFVAETTTLERRKRANHNIVPALEFSFVPKKHRFRQSRENTTERGILLLGISPQSRGFVHRFKLGSVLSIYHLQQAKNE
jgi:hypothetical protein